MVCAGHEDLVEVRENQEEVVHDEAALEVVQADAVVLGVAARGVGDEGRVVVEGCASSCFFFFKARMLFSWCSKVSENSRR